MGQMLSDTEKNPKDWIASSSERCLFYAVKGSGVQKKQFYVII